MGYLIVGVLSFAGGAVVATLYLKKVETALLTEFSALKTAVGALLVQASKKL